MIESNLVEGRQDIVPGKELVYGQSVTDACLSWEDTVPLLDELGGGRQSPPREERSLIGKRGGIIRPFFFPVSSTPASYEAA